LSKIFTTGAVVILVGIVGCTNRDPETDVNLRRIEAAEEASQSRLYAHALASAKRGQKDGFRDLYQIAWYGHSAERGEAAIVDLHSLFLENPEGWVKGFAAFDDSLQDGMRGFIRKSGVITCVVYQDSMKQDEYTKLVIMKLSAIKQGERERHFAEYLIGLFEEAK
jgi:hypothetical protein